jgi:mannitol-specific phosphotransferase system IIBC component
MILTIATFLFELGFVEFKQRKLFRICLLLVSNNLLNLVSIFRERCIIVFLINNINMFAYAIFSFSHKQFNNLI